MEILYTCISKETTTLMERQNCNKIYYVPGIISLILLPIVFNYFAKREINQLTVFAIPVIWIDTTYINNQGILFSGFNKQYPPKRKYTDIVFDGNQEEDEIKLAFAQIRIREILKVGDSLSGLHFLFSDNSSYGTFVRTIDKLRIEGAKTFMPVENNLWFYHFQPDTTAKPTLYGCYQYIDFIDLQRDTTPWSNFEENIIQIWQTSWPIIVLFSCFSISVIVLMQLNNRS